MKRIAVVVAVMASIILGLVGPATAEKVHRDDPRGDEVRGYNDITRLEVDHRPSRVRVKLEQESTPAFYYVRVDVPGGNGWDYMVTYDTYTSRNITVETRRQVLTQGSGYRCQTPTVRTSNGGGGTVMTFKFKRSCIGNPSSLRMRADAHDDQFCGPCDSTRWTPWASRA